MRDALDEIDDQILGEVRSLYQRVDPVPPELGDRLKFALTVQALHAEVAELTEVPLAAARASQPDLQGAELAQTITFTSGSLSVMISLADSTSDEVSVDGWVTRGGARIELQVANTVYETVADEHGRFVFEAVPHGPAHVVIWPNPERSDDRPVITPTIEL
ncbi:carboxypeptidase regulatory-like domain-containing protein [Euzebya tangerina]|uniref:carboxypeptidase regulatory-like domain-containing protein n=1 Tax=Euzebya tangerina TaxID=591198 RepID=UPI000E312876|nr:carboxypeptidase regulatory-like domain-containing protein [Euzebya tangerina]